MADPEEKALIERIKQGDTAPFARLVDKYQYMAYTIALKVLRNEEDAEDIAQESFIKAFQQIHTFRNQSKFSTWLYTIVYRTSISHWKSNSINTLSITDEHNEIHQSQSVPQMEELQADDERRYIRKAIERLPQSEGVIVTLYYLNDNTIREIEDITGFSAPNIKIKLFRARKKLERELQFLLKEEEKTAG